MSAKLDIRLFSIQSGYKALRRPLISAVTRVLDSGRFILGPEVERFEAEFAKAAGASKCLGLSSGTEAIELALAACGVGPGDEVIVPATTFIATATAVSALGARPVLADVLPDTSTLDPAQAAAKLTARTKAIVPVHLYGYPAEMGALLELARSKNLRVVEDCAQAHGALYKGKAVGGLGDIGCFSFYPTKNLGAAGDAGAITTQDPFLFDACRLLRNVGREPGDNYRHVRIANHSRLDEVQAAVLRVKLKRLGAWVARRRKIAALYRKGLAGLPIQLPQDGAGGTRHAYHLFVIRTPRRDPLAGRLAERGVETGVYYPLPLHLQPAYQFLGHRLGDFPVSERAAQECLALPVHPDLTDAQVKRVAAEIREFHG